jgi:predicted nucleic acid-binding Zn ribbon protein
MIQIYMRKDQCYAFKEIYHGICSKHKYRERILVMLYTIAVILVILWLVGLITSYTMGGFIHVLLVIAIVVILVNIISGRKPV